MSKIPAKQASTKKPAAKPAKPAAKAPAKAAVKPATRTAAKTASLAAVKTAARPATRPAATRKPPVKHAEPAKAQARAKPVAAATSAPVPATVDQEVAAPAAPLTKPRASRSSRVPPPAPPAAPLPPATSRFADRFAPPRPPTRQMNNLAADTPKHAPKSDPKLANAWKSKNGRDLSEAELLAMPESEYMNDKQLEFFRARLQELKDDLLSNADETTEHLREDTSIVPDPADRATIEEEHALELRTRDRERKLLKKISQSIIRIDAGDYGFCDETGEPIGLGRLIARPTATLSLEAQQRREMKQKMFGD